MTKISDIANEIAKSLREYTSEIVEEVEKAKDEVTKEGVSLLKQSSPELTGSYKKGWTRKKVGDDIVVHNRTDYQLTHLLEYGHANQDGSRTPAQVHIRPVEEKMIRDYEERVERAIKS